MMKPSTSFLRSLRVRQQPLRPTQQCLAPRPYQQPSHHFNNNTTIRPTALSRRLYNTAYPEQYPPPSTSRTRLRRSIQLFFIGLFLTGGYKLGEWANQMPEPGTVEDDEEFALIHLDFESTPWVQDFMARGRHYELRPAFREKTLQSWFSGTRGLAYWRSFLVLDVEGATENFFMFGRAMCGWPNTIHGGATATMADDCCILSALTLYPRNVIFSRQFLEGDVDVSALDITYKRPLKPDVFYRMSTTVDALSAADRERLSDPNPARRPEVVTRGVIYDLQTQETCAEVLVKYRIKGEFEPILDEYDPAQDQDYHSVD